MGGWVAMLYALYNSKKVSKLLGIAAAPDFTNKLIWDKLSTREKKIIKSKGILKKKINKDFSYNYSLKLFENSKKYFIGNIKKKFKGETILFHGSEDYTVPKNYNDIFYKNLNFPKLLNITIKNSDHSMSDEYSLKNIVKFI